MDYLAAINAPLSLDLREHGALTAILAATCVLVVLSGCTQPTETGNTSSAPTYKPFYLTVQLINERSIDASFFGAGDTSTGLFAVECAMTTVPAHGQKTINCYGPRPSSPMTDPDTSSPWNGSWMRYDVAWYECPADSCPQKGEGEAFSYSDQDNPTFEARLTSAADPVVKWLPNGVSSTSTSTAPSTPAGPITLGFRDETGKGYGIKVGVYPYKSAGKPAYETWTGHDGETHATGQKQADLRASVVTPSGSTGGQLFACVSSTGASAAVTYVLKSNPSSASGYRLTAEKTDVAWLDSPC